MGLIGWIIYIVLGIILFIIINYIDIKYKINRREWLILSIIFMLVFAGILVRLGINYTSDIFLVFVFMMLADIFYNSYILEQDFFSKEDKNIYYYILLIIIGFIINQEFINKVEEVFLTGEDLRLIIWFLVFIYLYKFSISKNILSTNIKENTKFISKDSILISYVKLKEKYYEECNYDNKDISNIIYSIMIYENKKRSKLLRKIDNFNYKINGGIKKLGIMQVESKKFITDSESINITYKKITKLYDKYNKKKDKNISFKVLDDYLKEESNNVKYIYEIIRKF